MGGGALSFGTDHILGFYIDIISTNECNVMEIMDGIELPFTIVKIFFFLGNMRKIFIPLFGK